MMSVTRQAVHDGRSALIEEEIHKVVAEDGSPVALVRKRSAEQCSRNLGTPCLEGANLLCIHGLGQNRLTFDLTAVSPANYFAEMGMDVWLVDLRGHGLSRELGAPVPTSFDDYVSLDVPAVIRHICDVNKTPLFLMGHSLGGTILYCLDPADCADVTGFIPVAGPYHFGAGLRLLRLLSFMLHRTYPVNPLRLFTKADTAFPIELFGMVFKAGRFYFNSARLPQLYRLWRPRSMNEAALLDRLSRGFDRTSLEVVKRMIVWASLGRLVDDDDQPTYEERFAAKRQPFFFVQGSEDTTVPLESIQAGLDAYKGPKTLRVFGAGDNEPGFGHIDLLTGDAAHEHTWPAMLNWMSGQVKS